MGGARGYKERKKKESKGGNDYGDKEGAHR